MRVASEQSYPIANGHSLVCRAGVDWTDAAGAILFTQVGEPMTCEGGYSFGRFTLLPSQKLLVDGGTEVKLGGRAIAILCALVDRAGEIVTKEELVAAAWPAKQVEEGNLRVHIAAIRRALEGGPDEGEFISNIIGRGYQFVAPVQRIPDGVEAEPQSSPTHGSVIAGLPAPLTKVLGRDAASAGIIQLISKQRLVSIVGPGGIGKTTVAILAARQASENFADGTYFVDLGSLSDESHVPLAVAAALGFSVETNLPLPSLVSHLKDREVLIILDNCEHLINAAATVVEALLKGAAELRILTTSHEPLRSEGEWLYRLQPLDLPKDEGSLTLEEAVSYAAVDLFCQRAMSDDQDLLISNVDVPVVIEICRRLDGIPLAIEIAAAQVKVFGLRGLAERLDERLDILTVGRRTAVQRHQTIRNMLDWSHDNLTPSEQVVLRRLAIFAGAFSIDAAEMVCGDEYLTPSRINEGIASLVRKSLLYPLRADRSVTYRLLDSTRVYALEKLTQARELARIRHLHLHITINTLERADREWQDTPRSAWIQRYSPVVAEVRFALGWVFLPGGCPAEGVKLTSLAMPLGLQLGLVDEFRERAQTALAHAERLAQPQLVFEMRLNVAVGILNQNQIQPNDQYMDNLTKAASLAHAIGTNEHKLEPEIVLAAFSMGMGNYGKSIEHAELAEQLGKSTGNDLAVLASHRILAQATHFNGEHERAASLAKSVLQHPIINIPTAFGNVQTDRRVSMRIVLARTSWMMGESDQAVVFLNDAIELARDDGPLALCQALALAACPILLWRGDNDAAYSAVELLLEQSSRFTLRHWHSWGRLFDGVIHQRQEGSYDATSAPAAQGGLQIQTLATLNGQLVGFSDSGVSHDGWCGPEILRVRGESYLEEGKNADAEILFVQSMRLAQQQASLAWELRSAKSLARLWHSAGKVHEANDLILRVYGRFSEGFDTVDLADARATMGN